MLSCSGVHECIGAQPHPLDPCSYYPDNHPVLLPGVYCDTDRANSQCPNGNANTIRNAHPNGNFHAHRDLHTNCDANYHEYPDNHSNEYPDDHSNQYFHPIQYGNPDTAAYPDAYTDNPSDADPFGYAPSN